MHQPVNIKLFDGIIRAHDEGVLALHFTIATLGFNLAIPFRIIKSNARLLHVPPEVATETKPTCNICGGRDSIRLA